MLMMKLLVRSKQEENLLLLSHCLIFGPKNLFFRSSSTSAKPSFIANYLVESCGFPPVRAGKLAKYNVSLTSSEQPDSVRLFLKRVGFADTEIRKLIVNRPYILSANVDKDLKPNFQALCNFNFTEDGLRKIVVCNPSFLLKSHTISRLEFWKQFFNGDTKKLLLTFSRNRNLINFDIDKNIVPKISLLKNYGFSENDIRMILVRSSGFIGRNISSMEDMLKQTQGLGFKTGSRMFVQVAALVSQLGHDAFIAKLEFFKSLGWSEEMVLSALKKFTRFAGLAEDNLRQKINFFLGTVGCSMSYIVSHPVILSFSMEKRLVPRHNVMNILKEHKLVSREFDLFNVMMITDKKFLDKFVHPFKDKAPVLIQAHGSAEEVA